MHRRALEFKRFKLETTVVRCGSRLGSRMPAHRLRNDGRPRSIAVTASGSGRKPQSSMARMSARVSHSGGRGRLNVSACMVRPMVQRGIVSPADAVLCVLLWITPLQKLRFADAFTHWVGWSAHA